MRPSALIPVVFGLAALILTMLCIFAGSKPDFMEDYAIITLNTSRIGQNILNTTSSTNSPSNPLSPLWDTITNSLESEINSGLNSLAHTLGIHDFYSTHLLNHYSGYYTPSALPNTTIPLNSIHKNVSFCSTRSSFFHFNPKKSLEKELDSSGLNIEIQDLGWPDAVDNGIRALRVAQKVAFVLYCVAACLLFLSALSSLLSIFFNGRISTLFNFFFWIIAFLAGLLDSAVTTAVAVKATDLVNRYGNDVGISATKGKKFLALTWTAAVLAFAGLAFGFVEFVLGRRRKGQGVYRFNSVEK